jgi:hypothetical protein
MMGPASPPNREFARSGTLKTTAATLAQAVIAIAVIRDRIWVRRELGWAVSVARQLLRRREALPDAGTVNFVYLVAEPYAPASP